MKILTWLNKILFLVSSVLVGNWVGAQIKTGLTGQPTAWLTYHHVTRGGLQMQNTPVITKFFPALLYAFAGKPRWLYGFVAGVFTGLVVDDSYEAAAMDWFAERLGLGADSRIQN